MSNLNQIHSKLLEIAEYFDNFCKSNNITYYLMGGTALGAIRHEGFIPWDDDYDVFMTYDNYIKFIELCSTKLDTNKFYLQIENTKEWPLFFSKLRMNNTTYLEEDTKYRTMHKGFYIDIMCLNNSPKSKFLRYLQYLTARLVIAKTLYVRGYTTNSKLKKITMKVTNLLINKSLLMRMVNYVRKYNNKDVDYVGHFFGRAKFANTSFLKSYLGYPRYVKFENIFLPVPEQVEKYLEVRFGPNYMEIPDEKTKSMYPSHVYFYDTEKDYKFYEQKD